MGGRQPLNSSSQASHFCLLGGCEGERKWHAPWADWASPDSQAVGSGRHSPTWCSRRGKPGLQKSPLTKAALLQKERKETEINKWRPKAVTNAVIHRVKVYNRAEDQSLPTAGPRGQELQEEPVFFLPALALESLQQWGGPLGALWSSVSWV